MPPRMANAAVCSEHATRHKCSYPLWPLPAQHLAAILLVGSTSAEGQAGMIGNPLNMLHLDRGLAGYMTQGQSVVSD